MKKLWLNMIWEVHEFFCLPVWTLDFSMLSERLNRSSCHASLSPVTTLTKPSTPSVDTVGEMYWIK